MESAGLLQTLAAWGAAAAAGIGTAALLRRRLSRDRTEVAKDRAETSLVELLLKERDQAIRHWHTATFARQNDSEVIARLTARNEQLERELRSIRRLVSRLHPESLRFLSTDPGELPGR